MKNSNTRHTISELRAEVDVIDSQILELIKKRFSLAQLMGAIKKETGQPPRDITRETIILQRLVQENERTRPHLPETELKILYAHLMRICLKCQE